MTNGDGDTSNQNAHVSLDNPVRRALIDWLIGVCEEMPETIGEPGNRALAWFHSDVPDPAVQVFTDDPRISCEVDLDARPDWASSYLSIPVYCVLHDIPASWCAAASAS